MDRVNLHQLEDESSLLGVLLLGLGQLGPLCDETETGIKELQRSLGQVHTLKMLSSPLVVLLSLRARESSMR